VDLVHQWNSPELPSRVLPGFFWNDPSPTLARVFRSNLIENHVIRQSWRSISQRPEVYEAHAGGVFWEFLNSRVITDVDRATVYIYVGDQAVFLIVDAN